MLVWPDLLVVNSRGQMISEVFMNLNFLPFTYNLEEEGFPLELVVEAFVGGTIHMDLNPPGDSITVELTSLTPVPEPLTLSLFGAAAVALALSRRRRSA
jgi:hypothetical protein